MFSHLRICATLALLSLAFAASTTKDDGTTTKKSNHGVAAASVIPSAAQVTGGTDLGSSLGSAVIAGVAGVAGVGGGSGPPASALDILNSIARESPCMVGCYPSLSGILENAGVGDEICSNVQGLQSCEQSCQNVPLLQSLVKACAANSAPEVLTTVRPYVMVPSDSVQLKFITLAQCIVALVPLLLLC
ncbi:hypothetical protein BJ741DRAFT_606180 [Chytriomyces cf. hyalinus JEL632]|nr:hypothetical protein BJ741DRAFT_606180 [Chytriomyces cf. hyalinus JEL632]